LQQIDHGGTLPDLPVQMVNLYGGDTSNRDVVTELATLIRQTFHSFGAAPLRAAG